MSLVAADEVSMVTGISKLLPSNRRCPGELTTVGTPNAMSDVARAGNSDRYASRSDASYAAVSVP
jgi:hypothetical protein